MHEKSDATVIGEAMLTRDRCRVRKRLTRQFDGILILPQRGGEAPQVAIKVKFDPHLDVVVGVDGLTAAVFAQDVVRSAGTRWMRCGRREPQSIAVVIDPSLRGR